jgi:CBS domain
MSNRLKEIAAGLRKGQPSPSIRVRDFVSWFSAQRRGYWVVRRIREELAEAGLRTTPNFEHAWIDSEIEFELSESKKNKRKTATEQPAAAEEPTEVILAETGEDDASGPIWVTREATYRISRLKAANKKVLSITPDETLPQIITKMMAGGFSQLPIMTSDRDVKGVVSWQSLGSRLALGMNGMAARDFSEPHHDIRDDRSIFDAIPIIMANDYVLVRDRTTKISGIITAADLSLQFRELTEPFLLLSEIENLLRNLIGDRFSSAELTVACDSRDSGREAVETVADLNFGEYIRLLQNPERWPRLHIAVDRVMFCERLDQVRTIRNDVMHFDPDGIGETELLQLRDFTRFLQQLSTISRKEQAASAANP